jgi:hypothetical protein
MEEVLKHIKTEVISMTSDRISCPLVNGSKFSFRGKKKIYHLYLDYDIIRSRSDNKISMSIQLKIGTLVRCRQNGHVLMVCGLNVSDKINNIEPYFCEEVIIPNISQFYYLKDLSCMRSYSQDTPTDLIINQEGIFRLPEGIIVKFIGTIESLGLINEHYRERIIEMAKSSAPLYQIISTSDKFCYSLYLG